MKMRIFSLPLSLFLTLSQRKKFFWSQRETRACTLSLSLPHPPRTLSRVSLDSLLSREERHTSIFSPLCFYFFLLTLSLSSSLAHEWIEEGEPLLPNSLSLLTLSLPRPLTPPLSILCNFLHCNFFLICSSHIEEESREKREERGERKYSISLFLNQSK